MDAAKVKKLIADLLTCNICENIGFRKGTALLLLPNCQHYICETCMETMQRRAEADNQHNIECPFCRVPFVREDTQSIAHFRYAESLAEKVLTNGFKPNKNRPAKPRTSPLVVVSLREFDMSQHQVISFMQIGLFGTVYTSAGALSHDFSNTGVYRIHTLDYDVGRIGDTDCRYDGLAFCDNKLFAINYTEWRVEIYDEYDKSWPEPWWQFELGGQPTSDSNLEIPLMAYEDSDGLHVVCNNMCYDIALESNTTSVNRRTEHFTKTVDPIIPVFANDDVKMYVHGSILKQFDVANRRIAKNITLINWTSVTPLNEKTILYTIQDSHGVYLQDTSLNPNRIYGGDLYSTNATKVALLKMDAIPLKVTASEDGYIAVLSANDDGRLLHIYTYQMKFIERQELEVTSYNKSLEWWAAIFFLILILIFTAVALVLLILLTVYAITVVWAWLPNKLTFHISCNKDIELILGLFLACCAMPRDTEPRRRANPRLRNRRH